MQLFRTVARGRQGRPLRYIPAGPLSASQTNESHGHHCVRSCGTRRPQRASDRVLVLFLGEFSERASYYGMRVILPMYISEGLLLPDSQTDPIYFGFKMAVYLLPLIGGFVADRFFGRYWTIVGFSIPYVLGHFILAFRTSWPYLLP